MSFTFDFTIEKFQKCVPHCQDHAVWFRTFSEYFPKFEITTPERVAGFITQCQQDTKSFNLLEEDLNLNSVGLRRLYPRHFPIDALSEKYANNPSAIANKIYSNKYGNGDEASGEGWKYRRRGLLPLVGKSNYENCSTELFGDTRLVETPDLAATPEYAVLVACWFWNSGNLNRWCDEGNIPMLTRKANGFATGLDLKIAKWNTALEILKG